MSQVFFGRFWLLDFNGDVDRPHCTIVIKIQTYINFSIVLIFALSHFTPSQGGPPVAVLSGVGLYVQDDDHNEIHLMKVRRHHTDWYLFAFALTMDTASYWYRNISLSDLSCNSTLALW